MIGKEKKVWDEVVEEERKEKVRSRTNDARWERKKEGRKEGRKAPTEGRKVATEKEGNMAEVFVDQKKRNPG